MLHINDLTYRIEGRLLFEQATLAIYEGSKVGLVGRNGTGKSTLFRLIKEEISPDDGEINLRKNMRLGVVDQEVPSGPQSLLDTVLVADTERTALLAEAETAQDQPELQKSTRDYLIFRPIPPKAARDPYYLALGLAAQINCCPALTFQAAGGCAWLWPRCYLPSLICCCLTSRPTIWTLKAQSGLKATSANIQAQH